MTPDIFLTVDDQPISLGQALRHLQTSRKLDSFIEEILRQHVLEEELRSRRDLEIEPAVTEQAIVDFRLQNQLTDAQEFQAWLVHNGMDYAAFHQQVASSFKLTKLKAQITDQGLHKHFIERKIFLDRVVLSHIVVANQELAEELLHQIEEGVGFEQLAQEHSLADDRIVNGMMGPISRGNMPDVLRAAIDAVEPGSLIGPVEIDGLWEIFRVEQFLPASLEDTKLEQALQDELFEHWLTGKIQKMAVKLQVDE